MESIPLTAAMTILALILQKPFVSSKTKDHVPSLERRLETWNEGNINALLQESHTIQRQIVKHPFRSMKPCAGRPCLIYLYHVCQS